MLYIYIYAFTCIRKWICTVYGCLCLYAEGLTTSPCRESSKICCGFSLRNLISQGSGRPAVDAGHSAKLKKEADGLAKQSHSSLYMGVSENSVPLNPMVLLIIIPIKWL